MNMNNNNMMNTNNIYRSINNFNNMNNMNMNNSSNYGNVNNNYNKSQYNQPAQFHLKNEGIIFVIFTFKKNEKQIFINVDENETFGNAIRKLEVKYNWLKLISGKIYLYNNIEISNFNLTLKQLNIGDNSNISILSN